MPTGTPYNSFVLPYRIKVDDFATHPDQDITPALHLLTHTHSDHITGLSAKSFGQIVVCSHDAKEMLLRHEIYAERELRELDLRAERVRTYAHLKVDLIHQPTIAYYQGSRDLLVGNSDSRNLTGLLILFILG
jgi:glyoxylase-like metal-dependent hydrolase (beta-lactamase superfamily II)